MSRCVELRSDLHAHAPAVKDKAPELILCIVQILIGQICLVQSVIASLHNIGFQTESCIGKLSRLFCGSIILIEDEIIIQMNVEFIHLIVSHLFGDILQCLHGDRFTRNIKHKAADFVLRIVLCDTCRDLSIVQLCDLKDRTCRPVSACIVVCFHRQLVASDVHDISFFAKTVL